MFCNNNNISVFCYYSDRDIPCVPVILGARPVLCSALISERNAI